MTTPTIDWDGLSKAAGFPVVAVAVDKAGRLAAFDACPVYYAAAGKWCPPTSGKRAELGITSVTGDFQPESSLTLKPGTPRAGADISRGPLPFGSACATDSMQGTAELLGRGVATVVKPTAPKDKEKKDMDEFFKVQTSLPQQEEKVVNGGTPPPAVVAVTPVLETVNTSEIKEAALRDLIWQLVEALAPTKRYKIKESDSFYTFFGMTREAKTGQTATQEDKP